MRPRNAWLTLGLQAERKAVSSKREAKRRQLLKLLDRIPVGAGDARPAKQSREVAPLAADIPLASKTPQRQPLQNK